MKCVVGIENVDYTTKDGRHIQAVRLHIEEDMERGQGLGKRVFSEFVSGSYVGQFHLGEIVTVCYTKGFGNSVRCTGVVYADSDVTNSKGKEGLK